MLSLGADLGLGQPLEQALKGSLVAARLAEGMGLAEADASCAYNLSLLLLTGCTADPGPAAKFFGDELQAGRLLAPLDPADSWSFLRVALPHVGAGTPPLRRAWLIAELFARSGKLFEDAAVAHCEVAQLLAGRVGFGAEVTEGLAQAFERWDGKGQPGRARGEQLTVPVRVAHVATESALAFNVGGVDAAVDVIRRRAGGGFDPQVCATADQVGPELFADLDGDEVWDLALAAEPGAQPRLDTTGLDEALRAVGDFADLKSPYTVGHSARVAELASTAAACAGLPEADVTALRRAGWLHDLGRVGVPSTVWHRPGALSRDDWEQVRLHPYLTERLLARPAEMASLAWLAGTHHERPDGSGYHRGTPGRQLTPAARILGAADAFAGMTEPRPHRPALDPTRAADELRTDVRSGRLDSDAVDAVLTAAGQERAKRKVWPRDLTTREIEVLRLLARGASVRDVAEALTIAPKTVDNHVQHLYEKLGVSTRAAATMVGLQYGLIPEAPLER